MKPRVKICGITNKADALFCAHAGADALGFIFYSESPRYIDPKTAKDIIHSLPPEVKPVGVFVNHNRHQIRSITGDTGIREIQLSGDELPEDCNSLPVEVVKAFRIREQSQLERIKDYHVTAVLLDGAMNGSFGGSGILPDYSIALEMKKYYPVILAGGLNPGNILDAIHHVMPFGVDVNSGIELKPGLKDYAKVEQLFERLRQLD